ncbi:uncharacterized protein LOC124619630 isoform X1 [Schistocerca americana]|uniref:uncharacterized protein LOC124619630 isoform X1 n=1 Tax=Schistocerca americana TaxID=7009 RepID=UPI001F4F2E9C|nr:uncharacterized protein LOC124619630 isoform X1 [Schistocerca americana]
MGYRLLVLWTISCLCIHSSLCEVQRQYHSEEEFDNGEGHWAVPDSVALEAADMLNTSNRQPGDFVNATELVESPHVVDLGGKTHEESGNTTTSPMEETCKVPIDWLKGFQEIIKDYRFSDDWLKNPRGVPLIDCSALVINTETKLQCPLPSVNKTNETNVSSFTISLTDVDINFSDDVNFPLCPLLEKLLNPTFNCSDRIEGNLRITVCHIPKQWLKDQTIITKLNCTNNGNTTTGTETCIISKEIVQKNMTHMMDCESSDDNGIECLVPKGWLKYNVFSILSCTEHENDTLRNCLFPNNLITTDTPTENCATTKDGNSTDCPIYTGINCTKNSNTTKLQCWTPHEWLAEVDNAAKLNCTNANNNSTQKVCSIPKEWLRGQLENSSENTTGNNTNETICYIPKQLLNDKSNMTQPNCSSDNLTMTCQIPNEAFNITTMCPLFEEIKETSDALRCVIQYEGNFTTFICTESEDQALQNETESCNTSTEVLNISSTDAETGTEDSSTTEDTKNNSSQTTEQYHANVDNSSEISTVAVPYLVDTTTESHSNSNNVSVKLNTVKDEDASSGGVNYEETEHNQGSELEIAQSSSEPNTKISPAAPGQAESKSDSVHENEVVQYEAAAALSQLHTAHTHATVNEQTVTFLRPTESAAILVGVFIAFAVLGYAGLLIWRRMLEKRYGNRQLLINEDDDFSNANNFEMPMYELQERFWPRGVDRGISSCDNTQKSLNKK